MLKNNQKNNVIDFEVKKKEIEESNRQAMEDFLGFIARKKQEVKDLKEELYSDDNYENEFRSLTTEEHLQNAENILSFLKPSIKQSRLDDIDQMAKDFQQDTWSQDNLWD